LFDPISGILANPTSPLIVSSSQPEGEIPFGPSKYGFCGYVLPMRHFHFQHQTFLQRRPQLLVQELDARKDKKAGLDARVQEE
jgi:hypothetical protein